MTLTNTLSSSAATSTVEPSPSAVDSILRPLLDGGAFAERDPRAVLLRVLCTALSRDIPVQHARRWLASASGSDDLRSLAIQPQHFYKALTRARSQIAGPGLVSSEAQSAVRLSVARAVTARILTPVETTISGIRLMSARQALAIIGAAQIESSWNAQLVTASWLGSKMGLGSQAAAAVLKTMEQDLGWIRRHGRHPGGGLKFKLTRLMTEDLRETAWLYGQTVDELATGNPTTPLAQLLANAAHPTFAYARVQDENGEPKQLYGYAGWVALVRHHARLSRENDLGLSARSRRLFERRALAVSQRLFEGDADIRLELEALALATGVTVYQAEAHAKLEAEAIVKREALAVVTARRAALKALRSKVGRALNSALHVSTGVLGPPPAEQTALEAWTVRAARHFAGDGQRQISWAAEEHAIAQYLLAQTLSHTVSEASALKVSRFIFRLWDGETN